MNATEITNAGIVTQLAVVHTMLPKVKELIDQQADRIAELEKDLHMIERHYERLCTQTKPSPDGLIDPKSYYIGYEDGKKAPQTKDKK